MMSPISVSQFLIPGGIHFDLVVFDDEVNVRLTMIGGDVVWQVE